MSPRSWDPGRLLDACPGLAGNARAKAEAAAADLTGRGPVAVAARLLKDGLLGFQDAAAFLDAAPRGADVDLSGRVVGARRLSRRIAAAPGAGLYEAEGGLVAVYAESADPAPLAARLAALATPPREELAPVLGSGTDDGRAWARFAAPAGPRLSEAPLRDRAVVLPALLSAARALEGLHAAREAGARLRPELFSWTPEGTLRLIPLLRPPGLDLAAAALDFPDGWAPEELLGEPGDASADLHALAALLVESIAGRTAGWAPILRRLVERPPQEPLRRAGLPEEAVVLLLRLLDPDPLARPSEAASVVAHLARLSAAAAKPPPRPVRSAPAAPRPAPAKPPAPPRPARRSPVLPLAVVALLALAGAGLLFARRLSPVPAPAPAAAAPPSAPAPAPPPAPPPPPAPVEDPEEEAKRALARSEPAAALSILRRAQRAKPDPHRQARIEELESSLRAAERERADVDRLERALAALPPAAAIRACDEFLERHPASNEVERILHLKAELRKLSAAEKTGGVAAPPAPPAPPPPPAPDAPRRPGLRAAPGPLRALPAGLPEALGWLARHQSAEGHWSVTGHGKECEGLGCNAGRGATEFDVGVSSLSCLAILACGIGWTDQDGSDGANLGEALRQAILRIVRKQGPEGGLCEFRTAKPMYNHALATYALAEALRSALAAAERPAETEELKNALARAVRLLSDAQQPGRGWRYAARNVDSDLSITSLTLLALDAAKRAGAPVPPSAFEGAFAFMDSVTEKSPARSGYTHKGTGKVFIPGQNERFEHHETMSAAALLCLSTVRKDKSPTLWSSRAALFRNDPPREDPNLLDSVYWYYGTRAHREAADVEAWAKWKSALVPLLLKLQNRPGTGCLRGSWNATERWSSEGGRIYVTAMNALTLAHATLPRPFAFGPPPKPGPGPRFLVHLKSGGQLRAVAVEDAGTRWNFTLSTGQSALPKDQVLRIEPLPELPE